MNLLCIKLQAHYDQKNIHRFYTLRMGQDLFGAWHVRANYGRLGSGGQEKTWLTLGEEDAWQKVLKLLNKRLCAEKPMGINYDVVFISPDF